MPRRQRVSSPRVNGHSTPAVPVVYVVLFAALTLSLIFNAYLFANTKQHVEISREEELVEEQVFQQSSDKKKLLLAREKLRKRTNQKGQENEIAKQIAKDAKKSIGKESAVLGGASDSQDDEDEDQSVMLVNREAELFTPEVINLNEQLSRRVKLSYKMDAMNSFYHSIYAVAETGSLLCLDRTQDTHNVALIAYTCHKSEVEVYTGPQSWRLSLHGQLFTGESGSVMYGDTEPSHTKVAETATRCVAFRPANQDRELKRIQGQPIDGSLVLVECEVNLEDSVAVQDSALDEQTQIYFQTWMYDFVSKRLVNLEYPSKASQQTFCLVRLAEASGSNNFRLEPCTEHGVASSTNRQTWLVKRLHQPKANVLTDSLDLQDFAFNATRSAEIGYYRDIGDMRSAACQARSMGLRKLTPKLPKVSVILCFYNEEWFALLRSVWGVVVTSPPELLDEVILVDDGSTMRHLHGLLEEYAKAFPMLKMRVVRAGKRIGLIQARMLGATSSRNSPGRQLIFLDTHIEPVVGWMEPLVASIAEDKRRVLCPVIPSIGWDSLDVKGLGGNSVGIFDWDLVFRWESRKELRDSRDMSKIGMQAPSRPNPSKPDDQPFDSPTMAGGLFAIDKEYFYEIGTYDDKMTYWGAENLEISFRIWMCGGILQIDPCSDVFHIFREAIGHQNKRAGDYLTINNARLAKVWLDQYQDIYFSAHELKDTIDIGDINDRVQLRKQLKCHSFQWYMDNFMPEMFVPDDEHCQARGEVRNTASGSCLDTLGAAEKKGAGSQFLGLYGCHGLGGHQLFYFTLRGELRTTNGLCVDAYVPPGSGGTTRLLHLDPCHGMQGNQHFIAMEVPQKGNTTVLLQHASGMCLEMHDNKIILEHSCDETNPAMQWTWSFINHANIDKVH